ncbi:hypothetical protein SALBM311S_06451 [Streptomyces alboniger]
MRLREELEEWLPGLVQEAILEKEDDEGMTEDFEEGESVAEA